MDFFDVFIRYGGSLAGWLHRIRLGIRVHIAYIEHLFSKPLTNGGCFFWRRARRYIIISFHKKWCFISIRDSFSSISIFSRYYCLLRINLQYWGYKRGLFLRIFITLFLIIIIIFSQLFFDKSFFPIYIKYKYYII